MMNNQQIAELILFFTFVVVTIKYMMSNKQNHSYIMNKTMQNKDQQREMIWNCNESQIKLQMGELSPQEMRSVKAIINMLRPERNELLNKIQELQKNTCQNQKQNVSCKMKYKQME